MSDSTNKGKGKAGESSKSAKQGQPSKDTPPKRQGTDPGRTPAAIAQIPKAAPSSSTSQSVQGTGDIERAARIYADDDHDPQFVEGGIYKKVRVLLVDKGKKPVGGSTAGTTAKPAGKPKPVKDSKTDSNYFTQAIIDAKRGDLEEASTGGLFPIAVNMDYHLNTLNCLALFLDNGEWENLTELLAPSAELRFSEHINAALPQFPRRIEGRMNIVATLKHIFRDVNSCTQVTNAVFGQDQPLSLLQARFEFIVDEKWTPDAIGPSTPVNPGTKSFKLLTEFVGRIGHSIENGWMILWCNFAFVRMEGDRSLLTKAKVAPPSDSDQKSGTPLVIAK